jgi:hypothetical protein
VCEKLSAGMLLKTCAMSSSAVAGAIHGVAITLASSDPSD